MKLLTEQDIGPRPPDWPAGCRITCQFCGSHYLVESSNDLKVMTEWSDSTSFTLNDCKNCSENGFAELPHTLRPQPLKKNPCQRHKK